MTHTTGNDNGDADPSTAARARWEERFAGDGYTYGTHPNEFLRDRVAILPEGPVLCLAEGEGRNAVFLAESGFEVHSVDLTQAGVAKTLRLAEQHGVTVRAVVGGPSTPDLTMTLAGLRHELAGLEMLHGDELVRDIMEGDGHTGAGAVVQVVAHKPG